jgi:hypothetical protein
MLSAGDLKDVCQIYQPIPHTDVYGDVTNYYQSTGTYHCKIVKGKGNAIDDGNEVRYVYPFTYIFRRSVEVGEWYVIAHKGQYYAIDSVVEHQDYIEVSTHTIDASILHFEDD